MSTDDLHGMHRLSDYGKMLAYGSLHGVAQGSRLQQMAELHVIPSRMVDRYIICEESITFEYNTM